MSNSTNATLQNAFDLIENNQLEDAQNIIEPLLETEGNNPAVWWVYAHAVQNPEDGMKAIDKVIQLDPTYPGASDLKAQLSTPKSTIPANEKPFDDWDDLDFKPSDDQELSDSVTSGRSPVRFLLIAIIVIVVVVGIFAVLSGLFGGDTSQTPTVVADQATALPTANIQIVTNVSATEMSNEVATEIVVDEPTDEPEPTIEPTEVASEVPTDESTLEPTNAPDESASFSASLVESLSAYTVSEEDIKTSETTLGTTVDVTVCAVAGAPSSLALNDVMGILVGLNSNLPENVTAIAVTLFDCNSSQAIPRTIGVERSFVQSFSDGEIELKDFQREWKPLS